MYRGSGMRGNAFSSRSEHIHVGFNELEHFLLSQGDEAVRILSFAENACDEGGRKKFGVLWTNARPRSGGDGTLHESSGGKS